MILEYINYTFLSILLFEVIVSGAFDAAMDTIHHNFKESVFSKLNSKFWNPEISWRNKYKDLDPEKGPKFFGSTTFLVAFTDGWHLMQMGMNWFWVFAVVTSPFVFIIINFEKTISLSFELTNLSIFKFVLYLAVYYSCILILNRLSFTLFYRIFRKKLNIMEFILFMYLWLFRIIQGTYMKSEAHKTISRIGVIVLVGLTIAVHMIGDAIFGYSPDDAANWLDILTVVLYGYWITFIFFWVFAEKHFILRLKQKHGITT